MAKPSIVDTFQTDGALLEGAWCAFSREHGVLVGLIIDRPRELCDATLTRWLGLTGLCVFEQTCGDALARGHNGVSTVAATASSPRTAPARCLPCLTTLRRNGAGSPRSSR